MIDIQGKLQDLGFIISNLKPTDKIQRCATIYRPDDKKGGWFRISEKVVNYGDWRNNIEAGYFWIDEWSAPLTDEEKRSYAQEKAKYDELQRRIEAEDRANRLIEIDKAYKLTRQNKTTHPYLEAKESQFRQDFTFDLQGRLVIPMINLDNHLMGYQYINDKGKKYFKSGSIPKESFYLIKPSDCTLADMDLIFAVEGYSTGSSVYQAMGESLDSVNIGVVVCFSANNVDAVCNSLRKTLGQKKSIIAIKDNDEAGLKVKTPGFAVGFMPKQDANDIHVQFGLEALSKIISKRMSELNE